MLIKVENEQPSSIRWIVNIQSKYNLEKAVTVKEVGSQMSVGDR